MLKACPCPGAEFDCPYFILGFCELEHPEDDCEEYYYYTGDDDE